MIMVPSFILWYIVRTQLLFVHEQSEGFFSFLEFKRFRFIFFLLDFVHESSKLFLLITVGSFLFFILQVFIYQLMQRTKNRYSFFHCLYTEVIVVLVLSLWCYGARQCCRNEAGECRNTICWGLGSTSETFGFGLETMQVFISCLCGKRGQEWEGCSYTRIQPNSTHTAHTQSADKPLDLVNTPELWATQCTSLCVLLSVTALNKQLGHPHDFFIHHTNWWEAFRMIYCHDQCLAGCQADKFCRAGVLAGKTMLQLLQH